MAMRSCGLVKLSEESAEVIQVCQKLIAYPELTFHPLLRHPDGTLLRDRLEEELGDALAAMQFVIDKLALSRSAVEKRAVLKRSLFDSWDNEP